MGKYVITRTSKWSGKPHPKAKKEQLTYLDYRTVPTLSQAKKEFWFQDWFDATTNHREDKKQKMIVGDRPRTEWTIEVDDLEEFCKKNGEIILGLSDYKEIPFELEIYDDYRE